MHAACRKATASDLDSQAQEPCHPTTVRVSHPMQSRLYIAFSQAGNVPGRFASPLMAACKTGIPHKQSAGRSARMQHQSASGILATSLPDRTERILHQRRQAGREFLLGVSPPRGVQFFLLRRHRLFFVSALISHRHPIV